jgi:hypothetical protein
MHAIVVLQIGERLHADHHPLLSRGQFAVPRCRAGMLY